MQHNVMHMLSVICLCLHVSACMLIYIESCEYGIPWCEDCDRECC